MSDRNSLGFLRYLRLGVAPLAMMAADDALAQAGDPQPPARSENERPAVSNGQGEIVVTATRSSTALSRTPISVSATTQEQLQARGVKDLGDLARQTPGIAIARTDYGSATISIRGISSSAGAATTGVYLDDGPLQVRQLSLSAGAFLPELFDLERTEILRGPQGTLFGAGSEGGTIRFIQPAPSFDKWSGRARIERSSVDHAGMNSEAGAAIGGPIIEDRLAFRASAFFRRQAGYIDAVSGQLMIDFTPASSSAEDIAAAISSAADRGPRDSVSLANMRVVDKNSNWVNTTALRLALAARPTDTLTITGSVNYQYRKMNNVAGAVYSALSDPSEGIYRTLVFSPGSSSAIRSDPNLPDYVGNGQRYLTAIQADTLNPGREKVWMPYVNIEWNPGDISVISTTSWLHRDYHQILDGTNAYLYAYSLLVAPVAGEKASYDIRDKQRSFSQEVRVQNGASNRLHWLVGGFYSRNYQGSHMAIAANFMTLSPSFFGITADGDPFPGTSAFLNTFGMDTLPGSVMYYADLSTTDKQYAAFGQLDFKPVPNLTLTVGGRYSRNTLSAGTFTDGPENNLNAPFGAPCSTLGGCVPGQGEWAPSFARTTLKTKENAFTPKFNVSWQATSRDLFYATVSKGFRVGGAQTRVPGVCGSDLEALGYVDADGNPASPTSYKSDSVMNYEIGSKNKLFGGRLTFDGNAYIIKWKDIQTRVGLPVCGYAFTDNLGEATSKGVDVSLSFLATPELTLSTSVGYNSTKFTTTTSVFSKGDYVPDTGSPFLAYVAGDYVRPMSGDDELFVHADVTYGSRPRLTGTFNPTSPTYQERSISAPSYTLVSARIGYRFALFEASVFANNLLNYDRAQYTNYMINSPIYQADYLRPRTMGVTLSSKF